MTLDEFKRAWQLVADEKEKAQVYTSYVAEKIKAVVATKPKKETHVSTCTVLLVEYDSLSYALCGYAVAMRLRTLPFLQFWGCCFAQRALKAPGSS